MSVLREKDRDGEIKMRKKERLDELEKIIRKYERECGISPPPFFLIFKSNRHN